MKPSRREVVIAALGSVAATGAAQSAQIASPGLRAASGRLRIDRDTVIRDSLIVAPGHRIVVAAGVTLTLLGDFSAAAETIFEGAGNIDMSRSTILAARPEWWGARANDPTIDNVPAFNSCLAAHPAMQLGLGDYHLFSTWVIDRSNRRIWGIGRTKDAGGTRLLRHGSQGAVVLLGSAERPPTINDYVRGIDFRWIELGRTEGAGPLSGRDSQLAAGLVVRHVLDANCEGLRANEHAIGFSVRGAVRTYLKDCIAFRSIASNGGRDIFVGFDLDGRTPPIPTGANASLFLIDCNASVGNTPRLATSVGCRMTGALSDTFLVRFETTSLGIGVEIDGQSARMSAAQRGVAHLDLMIDAPILDQCREAGLRILGLSDQAMVSIRAPYVGLSEGAANAIALSDCGGAISIEGGQCIGTFAPGATGVRLERVAGAALSGLRLLGFTLPVRASEVRGFEMVVAVNAGPTRGGEPAIVLTDCHAGYLRPRVAGSARAYSAAVAVDALSSGITVETAALDTASTAGVAVLLGGAPLAPERGSAITIRARCMQAYC